MFCIDSPVGEVGLDNLSLAQAYIDSTESLLVCQGVSRSIIGDLE